MSGILGVSYSKSNSLSIENQITQDLRHHRICHSPVPLGTSKAFGDTHSPKHDLSKAFGDTHLQADLSKAFGDTHLQADLSKAFGDTHLQADLSKAPSPLPPPSSPWPNLSGASMILASTAIINVPDL